MFRHAVALITAVYAIGFAFAAMAALRWPSLMTLGSVMGDSAAPIADLQGGLDWREIGLLYAAPYLVAAICFYAASTLVQRRKRGAASMFLLGVFAGFPPFVIFDFQPGWWSAPTLFETIVLSAAGTALVVLGLIWDLRPKRQRKPDKPLVLTQAVVEIVPPQPVRQPVRRRPVAPAIARQRASFAAHGRRDLARRRS